MSDEKGYNGWTNYETWCVNLWLQNDQGTYNYITELMQGPLDEAAADCKKIEEAREDAKYPAAQALKGYIEENNPLADDASLWSDMLGAAIGEVDWYEIAENWLSEMESDALVVEEDAE